MSQWFRYVRSWITAEVRSTRAAILKDEKEGTVDRAPSWWWQYKARPVAGLSQSVSGTYTFKVRVLEGDIHPRPTRVPLHEGNRRWASRGLRSSLESPS